MIVLDTSAMLVLLDRTHPRHDAMAEAVEAEGHPMILPAATLGELGYLLEREFGIEAVETVLDEIASGIYRVDFDPEDAIEALDLLGRFEDLDLGLTDATVAACALRHDAPLATLDLRDFSPLAKGAGLRLVC